MEKRLLPVQLEKSVLGKDTGCGVKVGDCPVEVRVQASGESHGFRRRR